MCAFVYRIECVGSLFQKRTTLCLWYGAFSIICGLVPLIFAAVRFDDVTKVCDRTLVFCVLVVCALHAVVGLVLMLVQCHKADSTDSEWWAKLLLAVQVASTVVMFIVVMVTWAGVEGNACDSYPHWFWVFVAFGFLTLTLAAVVLLFLSRPGLFYAKTTAYDVNAPGQMV